MKTGFLQLDCRREGRDINFNRVQELTRGVDFDLLLLPELFSSGYFFADKEQALQESEFIPGGPTTEFLWDLAREHQAIIIGGLPEKGPQRAYNSAVVVDPTGYRGHHRKIHLTGWEQGIFAPGETINIFSVGGLRLGLAICYDLWFPEMTRVFLQEQVQLICHPACFGGSMTLDIARARALENVMSIITANRVGWEEGPEGPEKFRGESRIINPAGELIKEAGDQEGLFVVDMDFPARPSQPRQLGADLLAEVQLYRTGAFRVQAWPVN